MDKAMADMIVDGVMDIRAKRTKYHFESDPATKVSFFVITNIKMHSFGISFSLTSKGFKNWVA